MGEEANHVYKFSAKLCIVFVCVVFTVVAVDCYGKKVKNGCVLNKVKIRYYKLSAVIKYAAVFAAAN